MSSNSTSSTHGEVNTTHSATTASTQATTVNSTTIDNFSNAVICAFFSDQIKEGPTNFALMAYSSISSNSEIQLGPKQYIISSQGKSCHAVYEPQLVGLERKNHVAICIDFEEIMDDIYFLEGTPKEGKITENSTIKIGGVWWWRGFGGGVKESDMGDRIDRVVRSIFGVGRNTRRKTFPAVATPAAVVAQGWPDILWERER
ncbi:hypothetical protein Tco_1316301 [Tanacetum coccineum]